MSVVSAVHVMRNRVDAASVKDLDLVARDMWRALTRGEISDEEAAEIDAQISGRREKHAYSPVPNRLVLSRFKPRQRQRSPDRQASRDRRRRLGGSSVLPDSLRHHYTEGQRAVLCIVAGEIKHHGICDLPIDKIAALAGVCRTTVQTTLHEARRLGHIRITHRPRRGQKSLPNLVSIVSTAWLAWLKRGPSAHRPTGSSLLSPVKKVSPTKSIEGLQERALRSTNALQARQGTLGLGTDPRRGGLQPE
ncbi:hypothetical protein [Aquabacter cavernae]|uniref:hypothetical protein n=1 Tax=Aquabacter cavernae TaxID=2496029 RepID=UPI000F8E70D6|nr:hypothetical protein [Aquabacter cavernae]